MTEQHHPPISIDEMAHAFEDEGGPVDLSHHTIEDWLTLAVFWAMAVCVFLQFFTRYALNNSLAWTEEIAANTQRSASGTADVSNNIAGVGTAAETTGVAATRLMQLSGSMQTFSGELQREVRGFLLTLRQA